MKGIKIPHLIFTAALCWLVLIGIQVKWISDSKHLIEEQFDQKVSLALAAAVGSMAPEERLKCAPPQSNMICQPMNRALFSAPQEDTVEAYDDTAIRAAVDQAFLFYDINMPYVLQVASSSSPECQTTSPYCCAITPFEHKSFAVGDDAAGTMLNITFPGKKAYVLKKIWWMLVASLFILLFVLVVFILAVRSVIHQQRISQWNIDFFNNMAHEFRTPLTNISLAVQRLVKRKPDLAEDKYLGVVHKEGVKLGAQIDRVLSIAELQHDGTYLQPEKIDLKELLNQVIADMELAIQKTKANVSIHAESAPVIIGDRFHLLRAFKNLIDNALKYTDVIPDINIEIKEEDEQVIMTFSDNGIGIANHDRELIFQRFHRIPRGNQHDQKGFGLGLSYVKMIIEDHKGQIRALTNANRGSSFELTLPLS